MFVEAGEGEGGGKSVGQIRRRVICEHAPAMMLEHTINLKVRLEKVSAVLGSAQREEALVLRVRAGPHGDVLG